MIFFLFRVFFFLVRDESLIFSLSLSLSHGGKGAGITHSQNTRAHGSNPVQGQEKSRGQGGGEGGEREWGGRESGHWMRASRKTYRTVIIHHAPPLPAL